MKKINEEDRVRSFKGDRAELKFIKDGWYLTSEVIIEMRNKTIKYDVAQ